MIRRGIFPVEILLKMFSVAVYSLWVTALEKFSSGVGVNSYASTNQPFGVHFMGKTNCETDHFPLYVL